MTTVAAPARVAPPSFVTGLASHGARTALVEDGRRLTYAELAERVDARAAVLGPGRLVLLEAASTVEAVVSYLACLAAGSPVLVVPAAAVEGLVAAYDPDVVVRARDGWQPREQRSGSAHALHPELALLLSTSGSTGSPKLVRLSARSLEANARAIASYLGTRPTDVAVTTLPMAYCYGLSVLHSAFERGAAVVLTTLSVVDPCFWRLCADHGVTTLAGVPHTFELLERAGVPLDLPSLRVVTQAGGRLAPERVRELALRGQRHGWDFYVMYGQTEATARMAYLPPHLAATAPHAIGRAVPGGELALEPVEGVDDPEVGELVYTGPNVMLGYAETPADLALGRTVHRLRTGDLARRDALGLYEVVGRRSRISKVLGLRVDLGRVEQALASAGHAAVCVGGDDELVVAVEGDACARTVSRAAASAAGLPPAAVRLVRVDALPRLDNGKPDLQAVRALAAAPAPAPADALCADAQAVCAVFADVLDVPDVRPEDSFVGLGGDSLSYVEASVRLERLLGTLPEGWHLTPVCDLVPERTAPRRGRAVETGVLLRAVSILLIVASHTDLIAVLGGAHVLLAVAGANLARFCLDGRGRPSPRVLRALRRVVVPTVAVTAVGAAVTERYTWQNALLLNGIAGPDRWGPTWHFWFVEVLVLLLLATAALLAVPAVRRAERRRPWETSLVVLAVCTVGRFVPGVLDTGPDRIHTAHVVAWLFALGWASARATTTARRLLLTGVLLATVPGFFDDAQREAVVVLGVAALLWVRSVRVPAVVAAAAGVLAASSLHVYVTHWFVYPQLEVRSSLLATVASFAVGTAYWRLCERVRRRAGAQARSVANASGGSGRA